MTEIGSRWLRKSALNAGRDLTPRDKLTVIDIGKVWIWTEDDDGKIGHRRLDWLETAFQPETEVAWEVGTTYRRHPNSLDWLPFHIDFVWPNGDAVGTITEKDGSVLGRRLIVKAHERREAVVVRVN